MLISHAMSTGVNIYEIDHNMDLMTMCKFVNTNFNKLAHSTSTIVQKVKPQLVQVHNDLTHRDDDDCHPISSISELPHIIETLIGSIDDIDEEVKSLNTQISTLRSTVNNHTSKLTDHEKRIKALEEK